MYEYMQKIVGAGPDFNLPAFLEAEEKQDGWETFTILMVIVQARLAIAGQSPPQQAYSIIFRRQKRTTLHEPCNAPAGSQN